MTKFHVMKTSTYDVHNICNLRCEGCSYFVTDRPIRTRRPSDHQYDVFFREEARRGVTYPIFSGAEPSLNQKPLHIAARHWHHGAVFTNGIKPIDADLPFRVVISLWGGSRTAKKLRGADSYAKALESASSDRRAIIFYTVTRQSIDDIDEVVEDCARLNISISFNFYSMTSEFRKKIESQSAFDSEYFRFSTKSESPALDATARHRAADIIRGCMTKHPKIVLFNLALLDFVARTENIHDIDPFTNLARDCAVLNAGSHRSFTYDLSRDERKDCCAPDFDCRDCRVLGAALATLMAKSAVDRRAYPSAIQNFRELRELMMRLYYWSWQPAHA